MFSWAILCFPLLGLAISNPEHGSLFALAAKHLATKLRGLLKYGHHCAHILNCIPGCLLCFSSHLLSPSLLLLAFKSCYNLSPLRVTANPLWNEGQYRGINNDLDSAAGGVFRDAAKPSSEKERSGGRPVGDECENELHFRGESPARPWDTCCPNGVCPLQAWPPLGSGTRQPTTGWCPLEVAASQRVVSRPIAWLPPECGCQVLL